jgi:hypothetical protein
MTRTPYTRFTPFFALGALVALTLAGGCEAKLIYDNDTGAIDDTAASTTPEGNNPDIPELGQDTSDPGEENTETGTTSGCEADTFCPFETEADIAEAAQVFMGVLTDAQCWIGDSASLEGGFAQLKFTTDGQYDFIYASDPASGQADILDDGEMGFMAVGTVNDALTGVVSTWTGQEEYILLEDASNMTHYFMVDTDLVGLPYQASSSCY